MFDSRYKTTNEPQNFSMLNIKSRIEYEDMRKTDVVKPILNIKHSRRGRKTDKLVSIQ